jgi:hypothetical protein
VGGVALARHPNDAMAKGFIQNNFFFQHAFVLVIKWLLPSSLLGVIPSLLICV